jgi:hypothetical protein
VKLTAARAKAKQAAAKAHALRHKDAGARRGQHAVSPWRCTPAVVVALGVVALLLLGLLGYTWGTRTTAPSDAPPAAPPAGGVNPVFIPPAGRHRPH